MNTIAHILMTLIIIKIFYFFNKDFKKSNKKRRIRLIILAFIFAVLIDLDHVYTFLKIHDIKSLQSWEYIKNNVLLKRYHYRTFLQESGGVAISLIASIWIRSSLPFVACLFGQCMLDWMCNFESIPLAPFYNKLHTRGFIKSNDIKTQIFLTLILGLILLSLEFYQRKLNYLKSKILLVFKSEKLQ